jgi:signal transduction histidine kinase/DNA-binding response OmpR family regulator
MILKYDKGVIMQNVELFYSDIMEKEYMENSFHGGIMRKEIHDDIIGASEILIAGDLSKPGYCFSSEDNVGQIYEIIKHNSSITEFAVLKENITVGFLTRTAFNEILGGQYGFSLFSKSKIAEIMDTEYLSVDYYMPLEQVSKLSMLRPFDQLYNPIIVEWEGNYFGIVTVKDLLDASIKMTLAKQQAMMDEMRKAEIAEKSNKAKSNFLAKMSHEIRTPMNAIIGITEIQLQDESHPPITKEAFEKIYNSGDLLLGIINDILDLSKIEAGKLVLNPARYDISRLVHDTVQLNIMRYESKPVKFILNVAENTPLMLFGDELRIKQILNNILSNAFKYTNEGTVTLSVNYISNSTLEFVISDTGQGMTAEQVDKLGTEYSRFNTETNRETDGIGLGMNITKTLIQLMNGILSIESTPGMGSTFKVRLPQERLDNSIIGRELAENLIHFNIDNSSRIKSMQMKRDFMPYGKVLVVDDIETNLYVACGLMSPYGLSIETVTSGFEAVDKIQKGCIYDVIFMDHMMPGMDGIEAVKIIRETGYNKPIVALTANAVTGQAEVFLKNGFDAFISKPIDIRQLDIVINKLIRDIQPPDVLEAARRQTGSIKQEENQSVNVEHQMPVNSQLAEFFIRDAKKSIAILEEINANKCETADDVSIFIINVHAMKSALANIGETGLSAEAAKLEKYGREQNINLVLAELPSFLVKLHGVVSKLESQKIVPKQCNNQDDIQYLMEKLHVIKTACSSMDKKTVKKTLAEIREKTWSAPINEQLGAIAGNLLHSEFDEIERNIDYYHETLYNKAS